MGFQAPVSKCLNPRLCRFFTITLLSSPSAPPFLLPFSGLFIPFIPSPVPIPYRPPSFTCQRHFYLSLHPLILPNLSRARSNCPPGWCPRLTDSTARLRFPPLLGSPRIYLREPVSAFPCLVSPSFPSLTYTIRSLSVPGFSHTGVPYSLFLPTPPAHKPLPPAGFNRRPRPLPVPGGGIVLFAPLSPVHPPRPPCVLRRILVLSEV